MEQIIAKYQRATGTHIMQQDHHLREDILKELGMLRQETLRLELGIQRYLGEDISCLQYEDLTKLEEELENSMAKVRDRQERILEDEHSNLSNWVAVEGNKPMQQHEQQVMDYFPFFEDQPADTLLQLAAPVLPHFHPYLHLAQPNFQHSQEP
ncbi:hypothetical protein TanjilG_10795 [Lupinus angustifolius]|uniref:K-box domain-containing protein n=1 Tax=Lupinus angustifolius TaxID=3871 RepID=A0A1J7GA80_LUPAN|nr:hypothetical protein TanjilG_10795 [Lupinus angustifolius]